MTESRRRTRPADARPRERRRAARQEGSAGGGAAAENRPEDDAPVVDDGWDRPPRPPLPDLAALVALLEALRQAVPRELQAQFTALLREVLLTLRALIDWYLERLDRPERAPRVEDIPID